MKLLDKTDQEILEIANPLWDELVKFSNNKDYSGFTKNFSAQRSAPNPASVTT